MQVILLEKIQKLGDLGTLANVKPGYARNYLIPQGKAKLATKANMEVFKKIKKDLELKAKKILDDAIELKKSLEGAECVVKTNTSDEGKLFGSINATAIVDELNNMGFKIEKKSINLPKVIREVGEYSIDISLHSDVIATIKVIVKSTKKE